jgi:hypothetical protein
VALIPPFFLDCVVTVGERQDDDTVEWLASGFFYGFRDTRPGAASYWTYLVTNRHVQEGLTRPVLRCNPRGRHHAKEIDLQVLGSDGENLWHCHPDPAVDIAATPISMTALHANGVEQAFYTSDLHARRIAELATLGVSEGDGIFLLGFPMGIVGRSRNEVIVRGGCVARIHDTVDGDSATFLVDANVFPGNSGGPVILRPEATSIEGTKTTPAAYLIGVVCSYLPYRDVAVSRQTGHTRVVFEENSGLVEVLPIDRVDEAIGPHATAMMRAGHDRSTVTAAEAREMERRRMHRL